MVAEGSAPLSDVKDLALSHSEWYTDARVHAGARAHAFDIDDEYERDWHADMTHANMDMQSMGNLENYALMTDVAPLIMLIF